MQEAVVQGWKMHWTTAPSVPELRLPENNLSFRSKKELDIKVNFLLAENILNLRMTKADAMGTHSPPPPTHTPKRNVEDI